MSEDEKRTEDEEEQEKASKDRKKQKVIYVDDTSEIEDPLQLLQVQLNAQFQHYRSESYSHSVSQIHESDEDDKIKGASTEVVGLNSADRSPSVSMMSASLSPSPASIARLSAKSVGKDLPSHSVSAPSSPKVVKSNTKANTLPHSMAPITRKSDKNGGSGLSAGATPKKSRSALLCNLFKRLSPKMIKRNSSKDSKDQKPWIVVEFSDKDLEDGATSDTGSACSDRSFEMALMYREEQLKKQRARSCSGSTSTDQTLDAGSRDSITVGPVQYMTSSQPQLGSLSSAVDIRRDREMPIVDKKELARRAKRSRSLSEDKTFLFRLSQRKVLQKLTPKRFSRNNIQIEKQSDALDKTVQSCENKIKPEVVPPILVLSQAQEQQPCESGHLPPLPMKTEGQLKVEQASIPRVHRIHQPPKTLNILNKIIVPKTQVEKLATRMASVESIGSCSLDVDATTASESSATADGITSTVSQRTLLSASIANRSEGRTSEVEKTIVKMPEEKFVTRLYVPEVNGTDEGESGKEDETDAAASRRQPSYVNISCSVSGYTSYACYNSKVREGLRSRDASPARAVFSSLSGAAASSVESSHKLVTSNGIMTVNGDTQRVQLTNGLSTHNNGDMKHARNGSAVGSPSHRDEKKTRKEQQALNQPNANLEQPKSLVEQRIERLYGPGALAQGFLIRAKARNLYGGVTTTSPSTKKTSTEEMNGSSGRLNHQVSSMLEGKPVGKLVAAVLASPSLLPRSATSSPAAGLAWRAESIAQATASFSPTGNRKHISPTEKKHVNGHGDIHLEAVEVLQDKGNDSIPQFTKTKTIELNAGHNFLKLMAIEQEKIELLIRKAEIKLEDGSISDDTTAGRFRAAIGKANLLLYQKFQQFRGLCEKNITQLPSEPFPTTASDLEGFWDMVLLQVENIFVLFRDIDVLQDEEWNKSQTQLCEVDSSTSISNGVKPKRSSNQFKKPAASPRTPKSEEAARAREEARKRLAEAKRQARSKLTANKSVDQEVEIFTPETKD